MRGMKIQNFYEDSKTGDIYEAKPDKKKGKQRKGRLVQKGMVKSNKQVLTALGRLFYYRSNLWVIGAKLVHP